MSRWQSTVNVELAVPVKVVRPVPAEVHIDDDKGEDGYADIDTNTDAAIAGVRRSP